MASCLIGLGSNLGNRHEALDRAVARLGRHPSMSVVATSRWHETTAIGGPSGQPPFLNGVAVLETALGPDAVLDVLQQVETDLGRRRSGPNRSGRHHGGRWEPRTIDLDLLLYDEIVRCTPSLVLPHPRMAWRRFVLQPAAEVAGSMVHPPTGWTIARLLGHLDTATPYVVITGSIGAGKTRLAERLAGRIGARMIAEPIDLGRLDAFYADPPGTAWQTELEFLDERTRLLAADAPDWDDPRRLTVSDFWFDQSAAFASVWLAPAQLEAFIARWEPARRSVARPKLIVLLDLPAGRLLERVHRRGRRGEQGLTAQQLERIGQAILDQASRPDQGPVLRLAEDDSEVVFAEALAAVEAMQ